MHYYGIHGLTLRSSLPLPEVPAVAEVGIDEAEPDIEIRLVETTICGSGSNGVHVREAGDRIAIHRNRIGSFCVEKGRRIAVNPAVNGSPGLLRRYLFGAALPILLFQRGTLTLHASAIAIGDAGILFSGTPGVGKSTLAAALAVRGHRLLCNDVAAIRFNGTPTVYPGISAVKLDEGSAETFGDKLRRHDWTADELDKSYYTIPRASTTGEDPLTGVPIRSVYRLTIDGSETQSSPFRIEALPPAQATITLLGATYTAKLMDGADTSHEFLTHCAKLAESVSVSHISRSSEAGLTSLDGLYRAVTRDCRPEPQHRGRY